MLKTEQDKALGFFSLGTTCLTVFNASIMLFFHRRVIGYRTVILTKLTETIKPFANSIKQGFRGKASGRLDPSSPADSGLIAAQRSISDPGQADAGAEQSAEQGGAARRSVPAIKRARCKSTSDVRWQVRDEGSGDGGWERSDRGEPGAGERRGGRVSTQ